MSFSFLRFYGQKSRRENCRGDRETGEERIDGKDREESEKERDGRGKEHRREGPAFRNETGAEDGERQGEEYAAAAERHGEIVPEEHLRAGICRRNKAGRNENDENGAFCDAEEHLVVFDVKDLTGHIPGDHGADAERESADGADEGEENAAEGDPCEPLALMGDEVRRKDEDGEYVRIKSAHVHPDGDR